MILSFNVFAQKHRYERFDTDPKSIGFAFKCVLIGGVIWGIGMILGKFLKKNESGTISEGQKIGTGIVAFFVVIGAIIAIFGFLMLGF